MFWSVKSKIYGMKNFIVLWIIVLQSGLIFAQERGEYDIISVKGRIIDKKSGKTLNIGNQINLQTDLEFGSSGDRAVLLNSGGTQKYYLSVPNASSSSGARLIMSSDAALRTIDHQPILITRSKKPDYIPIAGMKDYFGSDLFSVIGDSLSLPITPSEKKKYALILRFEEGNTPKDVISYNFTIDKKSLSLSEDQSEISECYIVLRNLSDQSETTIKPVTLSFVDEARLFKEFSALLKAMKKNQSDTPPNRQILKQYCADVYGNIDPKTLDKTISKYFKK